VTPILNFAQWLQSTDWAAALRYSATVYPLVLTLHLVAIAFFGGLIVFTDLRLLGLTMRRLPIAKVVGALRVPKHVGFTIAVGCGILLASSKAEEYYYNRFFWAKMSLLALIAAHGLVFRRSVYRGRLDPAPSPAKLAGALSLLLWTGVMICGRAIGYVEPPLEKLHALIWKMGLAHWM
jgi:uncharacterized membrane protein